MNIKQSQLQCDVHCLDTVLISYKSPLLCELECFTCWLNSWWLQFHDGMFDWIEDAIFYIRPVIILSWLNDGRYLHFSITHCFHFSRVLLIILHQYPFSNSDLKSSTAVLIVILDPCLELPEFLGILGFLNDVSGKSTDIKRSWFWNRFEYVHFLDSIDWQYIFPSRLEHIGLWTQLCRYKVHYLNTSALNFRSHLQHQHFNTMLHFYVLFIYSVLLLLLLFYY